MNEEILFLPRQDVERALTGRELEIIGMVDQAYRMHALKQTVDAPPIALRFSAESRNRIFAKAAYLPLCDVAGLKWVSSFPANSDMGIERASALVILNSMETGRAIAVIEGTVINAKRTAASAALAAQVLARVGHRRSTGIIGCGVINFEVVRSLLAAFPDSRSFQLFDVNPEHAERFAARCRANWPQLEIAVADDVEGVLCGNPLVSFATTAVTPSIRSLSCCERNSLILHISLRDLCVEALLSCENVTDDVDHVCSAQTSLHLAEQATGNRSFIRCTLGDILTGAAPALAGSGAVTVFSPFGLAVLDLYLAKNLYERAVGNGCGTPIRDFLKAGHGA
jgi:2,3-diaminopropionate biosynthesis protein SbnB